MKYFCFCSAERTMASGSAKKQGPILKSQSCELVYKLQCYFEEKRSYGGPPLAGQYQWQQFWKE